MTTVATQTPELALSVAALATVISPHLAGAFEVTVEEKAVGIKGFAEDVAHIITALDLERRSDWLDGEEGLLYENYAGPAPAPFASITVFVTSVTKVDENGYAEEPAPITLRLHDPALAVAVLKTAADDFQIGVAPGKAFHGRHIYRTIAQQIEEQMQ